MRRAMRRLLLATVLLLALAAAPAGATLVYTKGWYSARPSVWTAQDDGSHALRLGPGSDPHAAPNGQLVVYERMTSAGVRRLYVRPTEAGPPRLLLRSTRGFGAWSPDSRTIAALAGPELGEQRLVLIDVTTAATRTLARGAFFGASFSPTGDRVVYARAPREAFPARTDLYVAPVAGGPPARITHDRKSSDPAWGPRWIAYAHRRKARRRNDAPKLNLFLVRPSGAGAHQLTHVRPGFLLSGLTPTDWSADGRRLLAEFGGQDTSYAVAVNPVTGHVRRISRFAEGIVGEALSADGTSVLATSGGPDNPRANVVTIPYAGGRAHVLARRATTPDWNR